MSIKRKYLNQAKETIQLYREGLDLSEEQAHTLHDTALEHGQILDNVGHLSWFQTALAENLQALDCF